MVHILRADDSIMDFSGRDLAAKVPGKGDGSHMGVKSLGARCWDDKPLRTVLATEVIQGKCVFESVFEGGFRGFRGVSVGFC